MDDVYKQVVKPVYSNHARSWTSLVVMDRWSLYTGKLYRENARGSTRTGGRYIQVVAKAGLTVMHVNLILHAQFGHQCMCIYCSFLVETRE
jgi:hypothetical protein